MKHKYISDQYPSLVFISKNQILKLFILSKDLLSVGTQKVLYSGSFIIIHFCKILTAWKKFAKYRLTSRN